MTPTNRLRNEAEDTWLSLAIHSSWTTEVIMQDALYAQLLSMGFEPDLIEQCQVAMAQTSPGSQFNLQAATEWWVGGVARLWIVKVGHMWGFVCDGPIIEPPGLVRCCELNMTNWFLDYTVWILLVASHLYVACWSNCDQDQDFWWAKSVPNRLIVLSKALDRL